MYKYKWYFELSEEAGMAQDREGNPASCLMTYELSFPNPKTDEEYKEIGQKLPKIISVQSGFQEEWLRLLTKEEYESMADDEEDGVTKEKEEE